MWLVISTKVDGRAFQTWENRIQCKKCKYTVAQVCNLTLHEIELNDRLYNIYQEIE